MPPQMSVGLLHSPTRGEEGIAFLSTNISPAQYFAVMQAGGAGGGEKGVPTNTGDKGKTPVSIPDISSSSK